MVYLGMQLYGCWEEANQMFCQGEEAGKVKERSGRMCLSLFIIYLFVYLTALGLSCIIRILVGSRGIFPRDSTWTQLWRGT